MLSQVLMSIIFVLLLIHKNNIAGYHENITVRGNALLPDHCKTLVFNQHCKTGLMFIHQKSTIFVWHFSIIIVAHVWKRWLTSGKLRTTLGSWCFCLCCNCTELCWLEPLRVLRIRLSRVLFDYNTHIKRHYFNLDAASKNASKRKIIRIQ